MWTASFWKDAAERAIKTFAQSIVAVAATAGIVEAATDGAWESAGQAVVAVVLAAVFAALLSLLTSVASAGVAEKGTASVVGGVEYEG